MILAGAFFDQGAVQRGGSTSLRQDLQDFDNFRSFAMYSRKTTVKQKLFVWTASQVSLSKKRVITFNQTVTSILFFVDLDLKRN